MKLQIIASTVLLSALIVKAQTVSTSQPPAQTQSQPCGVAPAASKPTVKVPSVWKGTFDKYNPLAGSDPTKGISSGKPATPCPPSATPAPPAPVFRIPAGVVTTWLCNPVVTASDHSTSYVMPSDITEASPIHANTFEADSAKADPKATTSCSSLHKDPKTAKFWLAQ
jgi:hypothetical protein